jgi:hypothetical protein
VERIRPIPRARRLRYALTLVVHDAGQPMTLGQMQAAAERMGIEVPGRPSKAISDGLRWEVRKGRLVRLGRGRYGPGHVPRSTLHGIRQQVQSG